MMYLRQALTIKESSRRHCREGGNPEYVTPEKYFYYRGHWIPAFATMTSLRRAQHTKFIGTL